MCVSTGILRIELGVGSGCWMLGTGCWVLGARCWKDRSRRSVRHRIKVKGERKKEEGWEALGQKSEVSA